MFKSASGEALFGFAVCVIIFGSLVYFLRLFFRMGKESQGWSLTRGAQSGAARIDGFIHVERDSVSEDDDRFSDNAYELPYYQGESLSSFMGAIIAYLPSPARGSDCDVVWSVLCKGRVIAYVIHYDQGGDACELVWRDVSVARLAKKGVFCRFFSESCTALNAYEDKGNSLRRRTLLDKVKAYYDDPSNERS